MQSKPQPSLQRVVVPVRAPVTGSPFAAAIQRNTGAGDDGAKWRQALAPFLWPGGTEPADDYFASDLGDESMEADEDFVDEDDDGDQDSVSLPDVSTVQAKLAGSPMFPFSAGGSTIQCGKGQTPAQLLKKTVGVGDSTFRGVRKAPRDWKKRKFERLTHGGRDYYHHSEQTGKIFRTRRMEGPIVYTATGRVATVKTKGKRKNDANGHLIAHSFGGPPKFDRNFVAMCAVVNSAGGDWGRMETYVRTRLKQKGIAAYMVTKPDYTGATCQTRPTRIHVSVYFNKSPYKVKFDIACT